MHHGLVTFGSNTGLNLGLKADFGENCVFSVLFWPQTCETRIFHQNPPSNPRLGQYLVDLKRDRKLLYHSAFRKGVKYEQKIVESRQFRIGTKTTLRYPRISLLSAFKIFLNTNWIIFAMKTSVPCIPRNILQRRMYFPAKLIILLNSEKFGKKRPRKMEGKHYFELTLQDCNEGRN